MRLALHVHLPRPSRVCALSPSWSYLPLASKEQQASNNKNVPGGGGLNQYMITKHE